MSEFEAQGLVLGVDSEGAANIRSEETGAFQDFPVFTKLDGTIGHELRQVRGLYFCEDLVEVDPRFDRHPVRMRSKERPYSRILRLRDSRSMLVLLIV